MAGVFKGQQGGVAGTEERIFKKAVTEKQIM